MKQVLTVIAAALLILAPSAQAKRRKGSHPELCQIKTVAIRGNSEAASEAREMIESRTSLKLVGSPDKADAVLDISDEKSTSHAIITSVRSTVSATITMKSTGDILWSDSRAWSEGAVNSGSGTAVKMVFNDLNSGADCTE